MQTESSTAQVTSLATQLAALYQDHRDAQIEAGEDCVAIETEERKFQRAEQVEADREAQQEAEDAAFWGDVVGVAKCVAAAASVAGSAFTGGSTLVVAAGLIGGGLTVGSEVASRAGVDKSFCTGLAVVGAAASAVAGGVGALSAPQGAVSQADAAVSAAAGYVGSAATASEGAATIAQKDAESDETAATADSKEAESRAETASNAVEGTIDGMRQSMRDDRIYAETAAALLRDESQTNAILVNGLRG
jgi:hypothetical protein